MEWFVQSVLKSKQLKPLQFIKYKTKRRAVQRFVGAVRHILPKLLQKNSRSDQPKEETRVDWWMLTSIWKIKNFQMNLSATFKWTWNLPITEEMTRGRSPLGKHEVHAGSGNKVTIFSDYNPLKFVNTVKNKRIRLPEWFRRSQNYNLKN